MCPHDLLGWLCWVRALQLSLVSDTAKEAAWVTSMVPAGQESSSSVVWHPSDRYRDPVGNNWNIKRYIYNIDMHIFIIIVMIT